MQHGKKKKSEDGQACEIKEQLVKSVKTLDTDASFNFPFKFLQAQFY